MKRFACMAVALFVATASFSATAQQQRCTKRPDIVTHLANKFSEAPIAIGLSVTGGVIEVLTSEKSGSWTIIITMPNGNSCVVAAGNNWEHIETVAKLGSGV